MIVYTTPNYGNTVVHALGKSGGNGEKCGDVTAVTSRNLLIIGSVPNNLLYIMLIHVSPHSRAPFVTSTFEAGIRIPKDSIMIRYIALSAIVVIQCQGL